MKSSSVDNLARLLGREHGAQARLARDGEDDVHGVPLPDRQELIGRVGSLAHILDFADALPRMNDELTDLIHAFSFRRFL